MNQTSQQYKLERAVRGLSAQNRALLESFGKGREIVVKSERYFSRFRIAAAVTGSGPYTYTVAAGTKVQAFQYGVGELPTVAGFPTSFGRAMRCDTNLQARGETNEQELMIINGLGVVLSPKTDPELARQVMPETYMSLGFGGNENTFKLGNPTFWPGGGGLSGGGASRLVTPNLADSFAVVPGFVQNGVADDKALSELDESILWQPKGSGADSNLSVTMLVERAVTLTATARSATTGVNAFAPPTADGAEGTYVEGWVQLKGFQFSPRSQNR